MSDAAVITAKLSQVRRRQFLVSVLGNFTFTLLMIVLCRLLRISGVLFLRGFSLDLELAFYAAVLILVFVISIFRMPSIKETAQLVDRTVGLQQRTETSQECIPPREEIDALVLRDTAERISAIHPSAIVPIQFGRAVRLSLLIGLLATTGLGIVDILKGWKSSQVEKTGGRNQTFAGRLPLSKTASNAGPKNQRNQGGQFRMPDAADAISESTSHRAPPDSNRDWASTAKSLQASPGPPVTPIPDKSSAVGENGIAATKASKPENMLGSEKILENHLEGKAEKVNEGQSPSGTAAAGANAPFQSNAGAASIRRAERDGRMAGGSLLSRAKADEDGALSGGRAGQFQAGHAGFGKDVVQASGSRDYTALWSEAERALPKEKLPPGLKRYIADYFMAIHP